MKRFAAVILLLTVLLCGCTKEDPISQAVNLRKQLLSGNGCRFDVKIAADYGDNLYEFAMECSADKNGEVKFTVKEPETIAGICGRISAEEGQLHFDDQILTFDILTDGLVSPVSTPWLLLRTLRGGYISAGGRDDDLFKFQIDDSYEENPLQLFVWLDEDCLPVHADILWDGRRVVSLTVENFCVL